MTDGDVIGLSFLYIWDRLCLDGILLVLFFIRLNENVDVIQSASMLKQEDVEEVIRSALSSNSSYFGTRNLHQKDKRAILGSEWLGSFSNSIGRALSK